MMKSKKLILDILKMHMSLRSSNHNLHDHNICENLKLSKKVIRNYKIKDISVYQNFKIELQYCVINIRLKLII